MIQPESGPTPHAQAVKLLKALRQFPASDELLHVGYATLESLRAEMNRVYKLLVGELDVRRLQEAEREECGR